MRQNTVALVVTMRRLRERCHRPNWHDEKGGFLRGGLTWPKIGRMFASARIGVLEGKDFEGYIRRYGKLRLMIGFIFISFFDYAPYGIATEVNQNIPRMMVIMLTNMIEVTVCNTSRAADAQLTASS